MTTKRGAIRRAVSPWQTYIEHIGVGQIATDGVVYSSIATFGTTAVEILSQLIDPGVSLKLKEIEASFTQKFTGLNGSFVASMSYYWDMRSEYQNAEGSLVTSAYTPICGTYEKGVGTLVTSEDTISGYVAVGSVPGAPVRVRLQAFGLKASVGQGKVKNDSYVRLVGIVIPGT